MQYLRTGEAAKGCQSCCIVDGCRAIHALAVSSTSSTTIFILSTTCLSESTMSMSLPRLRVSVGDSIVEATPSDGWGTRGPCFSKLSLASGRVDSVARRGAEWASSCRRTVRTPACRRRSSRSARVASIVIYVGKLQDQGTTNSRRPPLH
jgi:hypothetical protein